MNNFLKYPFILFVAFLFWGCPYIDHGTTYATDRLITSIDEIQGCYYRDIMDENIYRCREICIDSTGAHVHERDFRLVDNEFSEMLSDTSFKGDVNIKRIEDDGTINEAVSIKFKNWYIAFLFYEEDDSRNLVVFRDTVVYSTRGNLKCEY